MVEIFKTDVGNAKQAKPIISLLHHRFPAAEISFDLDDCDNVLRIKGENICSLNAIKILADNGFMCQVME